MSKDSIIHLTGIWINESKNKGVYMQGSLGHSKLLIFKNKNKRKETDPDFNMYIAPRNRKREE